MINNRINNRNAFLVYGVLNLVLSLAGFTIAFFSIRGVIVEDWRFVEIIKPYAGLIIVFVAFGLYELSVKPSYIETVIDEKEIIIRTFRPNVQNGLRFIRMLGYRKHLKELRLSHREYNDYKLTIDKFGLYRILKLQKINKQGIYESADINISLLGLRKFTELILSVDRLKGKINLN